MRYYMHFYDLIEKIVKEEKIIFSRESRCLTRVNDYLHCTFKCHLQGEKIFNGIVRKYLYIYLVGYGNDGKIVFLR